MKFDRTNLDLWIAALRSGKYSQLKGALRRHDSFCCLGVGCEVAQLPASEFLPGFWEYDGVSIAAPYSFVKWLGLDFAKFGVNGLIHTIPKGSLAQMNDYGASFEEIADAIEEHLQDWLPRGVEL